MENQEDYFPRLYSLTEYTGQKASDERTIYSQGFEIKTQLLKVVIAALVPALFISMLASIFIGNLAILIIPVVVITVVILFEGRARKGPRIRLYRQLIDQHNSKESSFYIGGRRVDLDAEQVFYKVVKASKPVGALKQEPKDFDVHELFVPTDTKKRRKTSPTAKKSRKTS